MRRPLALLLCLPLVLPAGGGCVTAAVARYAGGDVGVPIDAYATGGPLAAVYEASGEAPPRLVVRTVAVEQSLFWPPEAGVRYVVVDLDEEYQPPAAIAVPELVGASRQEALGWIQEMGVAGRRRLATRAAAVRPTLIARRRPPDPYPAHDLGPPDPVAGRRSDAGPLVVERWSVYEVRLPPDRLVAVVLTYPRPKDAESKGDSDRPIAGAVVLPPTFETSGGDQAVRLATGIALVPPALAADAVLIVGAVVAAPFVLIGVGGKEAIEASRDRP